MSQLPVPVTEPAYAAYWYEVVEDDSLRQGDIFRSLTVVWMSADFEPVAGAPADGSAKVDHHCGDYIVISASCDVDQKGYPYIALARLVEANAQNLKANAAELPKRLEVLRQGLVPSQFLLPACNMLEPGLQTSIASHRVHALVPTEYLKRACKTQGKRLRMKHPFREKFGNWVGESFSRVGPEDIGTIPKDANIGPTQILDTNATI